MEYIVTHFDGDSFQMELIPIFNLDTMILIKDGEMIANGIESVMNAFTEETIGTDNPSPQYNSVKTSQSSIPINFNDCKTKEEMHLWLENERREDSQIHGDIDTPEVSARKIEEFLRKRTPIT